MYSSARAAASGRPALLDRARDALTAATQPGPNGRSPDAILLDAYHPDEYGGTGCVLDWSRLYYTVPQLGGVIIFLLCPGVCDVDSTGWA